MGSNAKEWNDWFVANRAKFIKAQKGFWIQEDEKTLCIEDMTMDHLKNAIKYVEKRIKSCENSPISEQNLKKMKKKKKELKAELDVKVENLKNSYK